jgi:UDP-glucose 4-epimerase
MVLMSVWRSLMKKVLIVGGAGFIGSYVNKLLHVSGYQTVILDNLIAGSKESVTRGTFFEGDMGNPDLLDRLFLQHKIDAVMHFAAHIDHRESTANPSKYYRNNVMNTFNLLDAMIRHQVNTFIFSSSASVYGFPESDLITENHPCKPVSPYGASKYMVERILEDYSLRYCALRYFNAAGGDPEGEVKNFKKKEVNLIPLILRSLKKGDGSITVFGTDHNTRDGTCVRDYVHVHDLARAHITAMERLFDGGPSSVYNLGNGRGFTIREVIQAIERVANKKVTITEGPRHPSDPPILLADPAKAIRELGWTPLYPNIETMIEHAWNVI